MATVFEKTWQFDFNRVPADNTTVLLLSKSFLWWLKAFLKGEQGGALAGLWTCVGSSDSVTAGMDSVDRWTAAFDATKIVRAAAGVAHSWIVLKSPAIPTAAGALNFYCIIDVAGAADNTALNLVFSKALPTGGTITARPVATDEWAHTASQQLNDNTNGASRFHGDLATDGSWLISTSKIGSGFAGLAIGFFPFAEARAADLYPVATYAAWNAAVGVGSGGWGYTIFANAANWRSFFYNGGGVSSGGTPLQPCNGAGTSMVNNSSTFPDFIDGAVNDFPVYFWDDTVGKRSLRGRLVDVRWALGVPGQGTTEPLAGPPASCILGACWLPSNQAPLL